MKTLQIYPQTAWHQPAYIVGDQEGLIALREALDKAIAGNMGQPAGNMGDTEASAAGVFCADGEGYTCFCVKVASLDALQLPYTDPIAADPRERKTHIHQLIHGDVEKEIEDSAWKS